jgi:hypothetical protein
MQIVVAPFQAIELASIIGPHREGSFTCYIESENSLNKFDGGKHRSLSVTMKNVS